MNKHIYTISAFATALAMSVLPGVAFAEDGAGASDTAVQVTTTIVRPAVVESNDDADEQKTESESSIEIGQQASEQTREEAKQRLEITREMFKDRIEFLREDAKSVRSFDELKRGIEEREQELDDDEANSTPEVRDVVKNANPVRLAVHALLASKDLLGGIGPRVSDIAREMNDSVATTTSAQVQIESRGFLTRFFFGGDDTAAEAISQAVARNQERVEALTGLLAEASVSTEVKAVLEAQIAALTEVQVRLQALAEKEQKAWGLFSWRF